MARRKNAPESIRVKHGLSDRLRSLRTEFYGERGGPDLARTLEIPVRTWYNYENGVTVPAEIILRIVELTSVEPVWLLRGEGPKFRANATRPAGANPPSTLDGLASSPITTLLRVALERLEKEERSPRAIPNASPPVQPREFDGGPGPRPPAGSEDPEVGPVDPIEGPAAYRNLRVADDAMAPVVTVGAEVAYAEPEPISEALNDKLVVASIDGSTIVRWFHHCGRFALLRAENPAAIPSSILVELGRDEPSGGTYHRVLRISPAQ